MTRLTFPFLLTIALAATVASGSYVLPKSPCDKYEEESDQYDSCFREYVITIEEGLEKEAASFFGDLGLRSYQDGQVQQMPGHAFVVYVANDRIRIRANPSLNAKQVGLITEENREGLLFKPYNGEWLEVIDSGGSLVGYSFEAVFEKKSGVVLSHTIDYSGDQYRVEFVGYLFSPEEDSYRQSFYHYQILKNGEEVFTKGRKSTGDRLREKMILLKSDSGVGITPDVQAPTQFHLLSADDKPVGWLFGWNKHGENNWNGGKDFSFGRVFVPTHNRFSKTFETELFTEGYGGFKFRVIADLLDREPNQVLLTPVHAQGNVFFCGACMGYYFMPSEILITAGQTRTSVKQSNITINRRLIESNPAYAFGIAFNQDDHAAMKVAAEGFDEMFKVASESCGEYDVSLKQTVAASEYTYSVNMSEHWAVVSRRMGKGDMWGVTTDVAQCLYQVLPDEFVWNVFTRTGLFPSRRAVDEYIENEYQLDDTIGWF